MGKAGKMVPENRGKCGKGKNMFYNIFFILRNVLNDSEKRENGKIFLKICCKNIWSVRRKVVTLHSLLGRDPIKEQKHVVKHKNFD